MKKIIYYLKKNGLYIEFLVVALLILFPLLRSGYVFLLDWVITPNLSADLNWQSNSFLLWLLVQFLSKIFGSIIIEKIIFLTIVLLILIGAYRLPNTKNQWVRYFCAFFYLFNPFVYSRFLYGHVVVLLAYALLPFLFKCFLDLINSQDKKRIYKVLFLLLCLSILSIHFIFFAFVGLSIFYIFYILFNIKNKFQVKRFSVQMGKIFVIFLLLSSYWLIPTFLNKTTTVQFINQQIDQRHLKAFQTVSDQKYGVIWNTAAMYGFWGDREGRYAVQKDMVPYWFVLYLIIFAIVLWGVYCGLRKKNQRIPTLSFIFIGIIGLILAIGIAHPSFEPIVLWLNKYIPFYGGYREPQKWVSMLILAYIYLGALGVDDLIVRIQKRIKNYELKIKKKVGLKNKNQALKSPRIHGFLVKLRQITPALFIIIPLLYSPGMLWGFRGQMFASNYPDSWFEVNELLNKDQEHFRVLFLPWHQYMNFGFAGRVVANPATNFFDKPIIAGDNMEMGYIYTQSSNNDSKYIEQEILANKNEINNLGEKLLPLNVKYVIFAQESDFFNYEFVYNQNDLELIYDEERIKVYLNKVY